MKLYLEVMYDAISACELELPEGYTHDDIDDIWVRYEDATIRFKDGTTFETEIEYPEYDLVHGGLNDNHPPVFYLTSSFYTPNNTNINGVATQNITAINIIISSNLIIFS